MHVAGQGSLGDTVCGKLGDASMKPTEIEELSVLEFYFVVHSRGRTIDGKSKCAGSQEEGLCDSAKRSTEYVMQQYFVLLTYSM